jgi:hypothetical protein
MISLYLGIPCQICHIPNLGLDTMADMLYNLGIFYVLRNTILITI